MGIKELHVNRNNGPMLANSGCDLRGVNLVENNYVFTSPNDKLNVLGAYYESINSPRHLNTDTRIGELVNKSIAPLKQGFADFRTNGESITNFDENNPAICPITVDNFLHPFCSPPDVVLILIKLPNKSSSGLDGIPPICLKHLPANIIIALTALFNNSINLCYFPTAWKSAKVYPILKKGKNLKIRPATAP